MEGILTIELLALAVLGIIPLAVLRRVRCVLRIVFETGTVLHLHGLRFFDYVRNEAFICFRNAENFTNEHGLVWNMADSR